MSFREVVSEGDFGTAAKFHHKTVGIQIARSLPFGIKEFRSFIRKLLDKIT
jgi:hypothetical protein